MLLIWHQGTHTSKDKSKSSFLRGEVIGGFYSRRCVGNEARWRRCSAASCSRVATLEQNGSIQIIRNIPNVGERVGHLLIFDGTLAAAFHRADKNRSGIEALLEIESDASTSMQP